MNHRIQFKIIDDKEGNREKIKYKFYINEYEFTFTEFEYIEIVVSFIRAFSDIEFIVNNKKELFDSTKWIGLLIMRKDEYGLKIELKKPNILLSILGIHLFEASVEDFRMMINDMYLFLNETYGKDIIDFRIFSPSYLEHMLGVDLPYIEKIEYEKCSILSLEFYNRIEPKRVRINEHELFKQLQTRDFNKKSNKTTNFMFESNEERLRRVLAEVGNENYVREPFCAVVYGNEKVVRDGTHRIACLFYLYGDIEVPIIRIHFSKVYYSYSMYRAKKNNIYKEIIR